MNTGHWLRNARLRAHFGYVGVLNFAKRHTFGECEHKYLFILCGARGGSTLLTHLIATSPNASLTNRLGNCEGQMLPGAKLYRNDWGRIKQLFQQQWDPTKSVHVDKSPRNLFRAPEIQQHFQPVSFLCLVRNPFAHAEGLLRRGMDDAAERVVRMFEAHDRNRRLLRSRLFVSYEDLTGHTKETCDKITEWMPELETLNPGTTLNYGGKVRSIVNMDADKIARLGEEKIERISAVFANHEQLLNGFGYTSRIDSFLDSRNTSR